MTKQERLIQNLGKILGEINEIEIAKLNTLETRINDIIGRLETLSGKLDIVETHLDNFEKLDSLTDRMSEISKKLDK
ncbi:MAG: hypothetical protein K0B02_00380 [DPANN group archaeon]|nr:hypothetical protein [DPANN group archaeon]